MKKILVSIAMVLVMAVSAIAAQVDINSADVATLTTVKGIGKPTAEKIIAGRPYTGKDQLVTKGIVDKAQYAGIKGNIVAKQTKITKKPTFKNASSAKVKAAKKK